MMIGAMTIRSRTITTPRTNGVLRFGKVRLALRQNLFPDAQIVSAEDHADLLVGEAALG